MKYLLTLILVFILLSGTSVIASDISDAEYYGIITVSNNGTAATYVSSNISNMNTEVYVDNGYLNSSANNCAIRNTSGADVAFMPGVNATSPWFTFVPSIGEDTNFNYIFYTNATDGKLAYFPTNSGMTTPDHADLELGNYGAVELSGFVNTDNASNKSLVSKDEAFKLSVSANTSETVTATVFESSDWGNPTSAAGWTNSDNARDDDTGTYANTNAGASDWSPYLTVSFTAIETTQLRFWYTKEDANIRDVQVDVYDGSSWDNVYDELFPTTGDWVEVDFSQRIIEQARIRMYNAAVGAKWVRTHELQFNEPSTVSATGIDSDDYIVEAELGIGNGPVLEFHDSATDYINCGTIYGGETKFWVSLWFKPESQLDATLTEDMHLWSYFKNYSTDWLVCFFNDTSADLLLRYKTASVEKFLIAISPPEGGGTYWEAGKWYHLICSISDVNAVRFILDNGTPVTDADTTALFAGGTFYIGDWYAGKQDGFEGQIACVMTGNDDLTGGEETDLYNFTAPGDEVDFWYIDEGIGTAITSYGTGGNDGTAAAGCSWSEGSRPHTFSISIDGTLEDYRFLDDISVPDNANDWVSCQNGAMPYLEYQRVYVDGELEQHIVWEYDTTFTDQAGNGHDAIPTFPTSSTDADVSAALVSFQPMDEADAPAYAVSDAEDFIEVVPEIEDDFSIIPSPTYPGAEVIESLSAVSSTPVQWPTMIIFCFVTLAASFGMGYFLRKYGTSSIIVKITIIGILMGFGMAVSATSFWMLLFFEIIGIALAMARQHAKGTGGL